MWTLGPFAPNFGRGRFEGCSTEDDVAPKMSKMSQRWGHALAAMTSEEQGQQYCRQRKKQLHSGVPSRWRMCVVLLSFDSAFVFLMDASNS